MRRRKKFSHTGNHQNRKLVVVGGREVNIKRLLHLAEVKFRLLWRRRRLAQGMQHSDVRLTMSIYADSSLFALRPAVEKLPWNHPKNDTQIDAQTLGAGGHLPSLTVTVY